jgi:hypothetical protein
VVVAISALDDVAGSDRLAWATEAKKTSLINCLNAAGFKAKKVAKIAKIEYKL